jgi:hypothetical protein
MVAVFKHRRNTKYIQNFNRKNLTKSDHLEDQVVNKRIIIKMDLKRDIIIFPPNISCEKQNGQNIGLIASFIIFIILCE